MTPAFVRKWGGARRVLVRRATKTSYCIESTLRPKVHYDGPRGPARRGPCGFRGTVVPSPKAQPAPPPPPADIAAAQKRLRTAVAWLIAYYSDHETYAGATVAKLREYDDATLKLPDIAIAWTTSKEFCLETGAGSYGTYHLRGPAEAPKPGACPTKP